MPLAHVMHALIAIYLIAFNAIDASAQALQAVPALSARVVDQTHTLAANEAAALEARLARLEQESGVQMVVLMVASTAPEDIAAYANRLANEWKIGRREVGDGLLLVVAKQDRKLRIEVSKALEGTIPDLAARQIIDEAISPQFKQGHFAEGLTGGIEAVSARVRSGAATIPADVTLSPPLSAPQEFSWADAGIFLFFALPLVAGLARAVFGAALGGLVVGLGVGYLAHIFTQNYALATLAAVLAMAWTLFFATDGGLSTGGTGGGGGWGSRSSGSGSSSSSGFSSGGGGDFGGGGASGDW